MRAGRKASVRVGRVAVALAGAVVASAAPPTTGPAAAGAWLAKVDADVAALPLAPPADLATLRATLFAIDVDRLAPTDARRRVALRLIDADGAAELDRSPSAEQARGTELAVAAYHAQLGDVAGARQHLAAADRPQRAPPTTDPFVHAAMGGISDAVRAETLLLAGDPAALDKVVPDVIRFGLLNADLTWSGHPAEAAKVRAWYAGKLAEADSGVDAVNVVGAFAGAGDWASAMKIVSDGQTPHGKAAALSPDQTLRAYTRIAREAALADRRDVSLTARRAAVDALHRVEFPTSDGLPLAELCGGSGDRDGFNAVAAVLSAAFETAAPSSGSDRARLARLYAAVGDRPAYRATAAAAEAAAAAYAAKPTPDEYQKHAAVAAYFAVAGAYARGGDVADVDRVVAAAGRVKPFDADDWDDAWSCVVDGYADAGRLPEAMAAAARNPDKQYRSDVVRIARRLAAAGRVDEAWALVRPLGGRNRSDAEYQLTVAAVQAGSADGVAARAAAAPTPQERALIDLATARTLLGKPYDGAFERYRPLDF